MKGSNAYPENFDDFMKVLGELYKIIDVQAFWEGDNVVRDFRVD